MATYSHFAYTAIPDWPRLAWVARADSGQDSIAVFHGRCVETTPQWFVEGAWVGEFEEGDFDHSDITTCSGIRLRNGIAHCVTPSDTLSRLYYYSNKGSVFVSNTLPGLLVMAGLDLVEDFDYGTALQSIVDGLNQYQRSIPSCNGDIEILYFYNLELDAGRVSRCKKTQTATEFSTFSIYRDFLQDRVCKMVNNSQSAKRKYPAETYTTLSAGYDSVAISVLAREAGVKKGFTISRARRTSRNMLNIDDSGMEIAARLGIDCRAYSRAGSQFPYEDAAWAAMGQIGDLSLSLFNYSDTVSLLFTGFYGDIVWDRHKQQSHLMQRTDSSGARFSEARLVHGVFLCAPTFWGGEREQQIITLSSSSEMQQWSVRKRYDRPVARRIVEEAGIPRNQFARNKKATSFYSPHGKPRSKVLQTDFADYLRRRGKKCGTKWDEILTYVLEGLDYYLFRKLPKGMRFTAARWTRIPSATDYYIWSNRRLMTRYAQSVQKSTQLLGIA